MGDKKIGRNIHFFYVLLKNISTVFQKIAICDKSNSSGKFWPFFLKSMVILLFVSNF